MTFQVKTDTFEGPLDLLLDLIEKRKLLINDVSLAKVTDDFIAHIQGAPNISMGESAHFILVASTLLLIKSRSLLPELNLTQEEKEDIRDLETRLQIYKIIKSTCGPLSRMFGVCPIYPQDHQVALERIFAPASDLSLDNTLASLHELLKRLPKKEQLPQIIVKKVISLEEMIGNLTERVSTHLRMSFREFSKDHKENRVNVIVSFLAMLELVKQGSINVAQDREFGDIMIETINVGVPKY